METKKNIKKKFLYAGIVLLIPVILILGRKYLSQLPQDYTLSEVTKVYRASKVGWKVVFKYSVQNKSFTIEERLDSFKEKPEVGDLYIVSFPERFNGRFGFIRNDISITNLTIDVPTEGWDELPSSF